MALEGCRDGPDGLSLTLRAQPRAARNELLLSDGGELKARTTAPPVDSAANVAIQALLADVFGIAKSRVRLVSGDKSRTKVFHVAGDAAVLRACLAAYLASRAGA